MKNRNRRMISWLILISLLVTIIPVINAEAKEPDNQCKDNYYRILEEYYRNSFDLNKEELESLQYTTVEQLVELGYEAYAINPGNYSTMEKRLKTNFNEVNVKPCDHCIIIISGSTENYRGAGSSFSYTYDGTTYTLRTFTVTASDNSSYGKASSVDVLSSKVKSVIQSCLSAGISTLVGAVNTALGTVSTICGLVIDNFSFAQTSTMTMNCGSNWTRAYTQVYNASYDTWYNGSCTEYVCQFTYMSGLYYSSSVNHYVSVPTNQSLTYTYASNYYNNTWRRQNAVIGYLNSYVFYDLTGNVKYYYNGVLKVTHSENF